MKKFFLLTLVLSLAGATFAVANSENGEGVEVEKKSKECICPLKKDS